MRTAEEIIYNKNYTHEYLSQDGLASFNEASRNLLFGADHQILNENRVYSIQAISGTGSLRLALDFIKQEFPNTTVYIPSVTWGNHPAMVDAVGLKQAQYSYLDKFGTGLDFESYPIKLSIHFLSMSALGTLVSSPSVSRLYSKCLFCSCVSCV